MSGRIPRAVPGQRHGLARPSSRRTRTRGTPYRQDGRRTSTPSRARARGRDRTSILVAWARQAEPPGGWVVSTLLAAAVVAAIALLLPQSPAGRPIRDLLGAGTWLGIAWPVWIAWRLVRRGHVEAPRATALAILSIAYLVTQTVRDDAGGAVGRSLTGVLDEGFGRAGGLALLGIATLVSVVVAIGSARVGIALAFLGRLAWRVRPAGLALPEPRRRRLAQAAIPSVEHTGPHDIVILGPHSAAAAQPASAVAPERPAPPPTPRSVRPVAPDQTSWARPDPHILGVANDKGTFSPADLRARARTIEETLASFGVEVRVVEVQQGPAITQFGLDPAPGVPVNKIVTRQHDMALRLGAPSLRVLAPVPGRPLVGIEVPNTSVATVKLGDLLSAPTFSKARLPLGLGMDVSGRPVVGDLAKMPHLLIAGATGSGKSVCINSLIASLLAMRTPDEVQFILIDPKQVEMSQYKGLPHLRLPVVTDMDKVVASLRWAVLEMERRYARFSEVGARNILAFNERYPAERLSYLVVVIDELADMMMTAAEDVERLICRLAQLGRAAGVHLVVATQRPSVDVLTGLIKANLPTRVAFAVSSQTDSRVILDRVGAERLLGRGDALYQAGDEMNPRRVQGAFVSDDEIEALCNHWRGQALPRHTDEDEVQLEQLARQQDPEERLLAQARELLAEHNGDVSVSYLQRRLRIGHQKAARIHQTLVADEAAAQAGPVSED